MFRPPIRAEFAAYCMPDGVLDIAPKILCDSASDHGGFYVTLGNSYNRATNVHAFGDKVELKHVPLKAKEIHTIILSVDATGNAEASIDGKVVYTGTAPKDKELAGHVMVGGGQGDVVYTKVVIRAEKVSEN
jgi:hypothetical protein